MSSAPLISLNFIDVPVSRVTQLHSTAAAEYILDFSHYHSPFEPFWLQFRFPIWLPLFPCSSPTAKSHVLSALHYAIETAQMH
jgi:hypothetical protein